MRELKITNSITKRDEGTLNKYLADVSNIEMITVEEEIELARKIREENDDQAMDKLVKSNLRFVISVAKQYQGQGLPLQDMINEGNMGLIKAATRFDETKGFKFISYAVWWIRQTILQALSEQSRTVRVPYNQITNINKLRKQYNKLEQEYGREPSVSEIVDVGDFNNDKVDELMRIKNRPLSIDAKVNESEEDTHLSLMEDENSVQPEDGSMKESLSTDLNRVLSNLKPKEETIIKAYFGIGEEEKTLSEVSKMVGLTRERVRQIKDKAIKKLQVMGKKRLLYYLS